MKMVEYRNGARLLLAQGVDELEAGDTRQASEKGWGAAAQMVKAVAEGRGWRHQSHAALFRAVSRIVEETGENHIRTWFVKASFLHQNFYENWGDYEYVADGLFDVRSFLDRLAPLVNGDFSSSEEGDGP